MEIKCFVSYRLEKQVKMCYYVRLAATVRSASTVGIAGGEVSVWCGAWRGSGYADCV